MRMKTKFVKRYLSTTNSVLLFSNYIHKVSSIAL